MSGFISQAISRARFQVRIQQNLAAFLIVLTLGAGSLCLAQDVSANPSYDAAPYETEPQVMSGNELANLLAPIALYPDGLLGQVLVASTYPLQVGEAERFLQQNGNLPTRELLDAARHQDWDASVQVLVAFPDVVALLSRDMTWTTELGNAFLTQQADVMNVVQSLRADARENGQLASTPQLSVNTEVEGDRSAIEIQPVDPQTMFVPTYDPNAVWGPPAEGAYPQLPYAPGVGFADVLGTVANLAGLLPGIGLPGPRGWGWALGWLADALFVNNGFFTDFGFHGYGGERGTSVWVRDRGHGLGSDRDRSHDRWAANGRDRDPHRKSRVVGGENSRGSVNAANGSGLKQFGDGGGGSVTRSAHPEKTAPGDNRGVRVYPAGKNSYIAANGASRSTYEASGFGSSGYGSQYSSSGYGSSAYGSRSDLSRNRYLSSNGGYTNTGNGRIERSPALRSVTSSRPMGTDTRYSSARMMPDRGRISSERGYSEQEFSSNRRSSWLGTSSYPAMRGWSMHGSSTRRPSSSSSYGSTSRGSSSYGWSSHASSRSYSQKAPKYKAPKYKAPKYKAPKYAKSSGGGGHSSGGHSKKSHRG